jgi:hypothetical protein
LACAKRGIDLSAVMPAHSRPKDGVASLAYDAGIHVLLKAFFNAASKNVDGRDKPGHDDLRYSW